MMSRQLCAMLLVGAFAGAVHVSGGGTVCGAAVDKHAPPNVELQRDDDAGVLRVLIGGREALVYQHASSLDLPHYWPMRSPAGRDMLVQQTEPYPHHRAFWFADTVRLAGQRPVSTYNALYSGKNGNRKPYESPYRDHVRHLRFTKVHAAGRHAVIDADLLWEMDGRTPVLDERRLLRVESLGDGEYLLDVTFTLRASYGDVTFVSDAVHYAWPYLRMHETFSGDQGGVITADDGRSGQAKTNMQPARWIDYSKAFDDGAEGLTVFQWPDGEAHRWLTREYGTFGPRRNDERSGKPFTLAKGQSVTQRVGILVHRGDVTAGKVAERYAKYIAGTP